MSILKKKPLIMGILNITDDSFSDGGKFLKLNKAIKHAHKMVEAGADIIDIGGESSRPFSKRITEEEEIKRVLPVISALVKENFPLPISIDTSKIAVAKRALDEGVNIINDITALKDKEMAKIVASYDVYIVLMHMLGDPTNMQLSPSYSDVVKEIKEFLSERIEFALQNKIKKDKIIIDPGIGFGKNREHNFSILKGIKEFKKLECPILLGCSKKTFIRECLGDGKAIDVLLPEVELGSQIVNFYCALQGADIIRVHNVENSKNTLKFFDKLA